MRDAYIYQVGDCFGTWGPRAHDRGISTADAIPDPRFVDEKLRPSRIILDLLANGAHRDPQIFNVVGSAAARSIGLSVGSV